MATMILSKERDNTWLQLPVCPTQLKKKEECNLPIEQCSYAHPPDHIEVLTNGYVVSCHDFVFSHGSTKRGCTRPQCKYFHPPTHLRLMVITNGKNNKRLRNELTRQHGGPATGHLSGLSGLPNLAPRTNPYLTGNYYNHLLPTQTPTVVASAPALYSQLTPQVQPATALNSPLLPLPLSPPPAKKAQEQPREGSEPDPPGTTTDSPATKRRRNNSATAEGPQEKRSLPQQPLIPNISVTQPATHQYLPGTQNIPYMTSVYQQQTEYLSQMWLNQQLGVMQQQQQQQQQALADQQQVPAFYLPYFQPTSYSYPPSYRF